MKTPVSGNAAYLLQFLHHFLDAQISAVTHFVLHVSQPVAELFVFVTEDGPSIETIGDLLLARGHLGSKSGVDRL